MWTTVAAHLIPAAATLYGLVVLVTGEVTGFGSRTVRGAPARGFGLILAAALPLAIVVGPYVKLDFFPVKPDFIGQNRQVEIVRDILAERRALDAWRKANEPAAATEHMTIPELNARRRALDKFLEEYRKRIAESDLKIKALEEEDAELRAAADARRAEKAEQAKQTGALWVGSGILFSVWAVIWLIGKKPSLES